MIEFLVISTFCFLKLTFLWLVVTKEIILEIVEFVNCSWLIFFDAPISG